MAGEKPGWEERAEDFAGRDGTRLHEAALVPAAPRAVVGVVPGYADHGGRYRHVLEALAGAGFEAHALDYRGHGLAAGKRGYIGRFDEYIQDLDAFVERLAARAAGKPVFLVGHSLGGLIGALWAAGQGAGRLAGLVLSSPYVQLRLEPTFFQLFLAKVVGAVVPFLPIKSPLKSDMFTHDVEMQKRTDADPLYFHVVTPRFFTESLAAQARLLREAERLTLPLLVFAGADDPVAHPDGAKAVHDAARSADKKLTMHPGMLHETLNEVERAKPIGEVVAWIGAHAKARTEAA